MTITPEGKLMLQELINFIKELHYKKFDFSSYVSKWDDKNHCGTICCALGWAPKLFPDKFQWADAYAVKTTGTEPVYHESAAARVFGISYTCAMALFTGEEYPELHIPKLSLYSSKKEWVDRAQRILDRLKVVESN